MKTADFYYDLPEELIAQDPLAERSSSRLMVLDRESGEIQHKIFKEIIDELNPEDCLVINDTKVIPARLHGAKEDTGAHIEVLLLKRKNDSVWETLVRPGKKARPGTRISFGDGLLVGEVIDVVEEGNRLIRFEYDGIFEEVLDKLGEMPLPPYITHKLQDKNRYQTVYAKHEGSAAAPTAGVCAAWKPPASSSVSTLPKRLRRRASRKSVRKSRLPRPQKRKIPRAKADASATAPMPAAVPTTPSTTENNCKELV